MSIGVTTTEKRLRDHMLRPAAITGLLGIALVHLLDFQHTWHDVKWLGGAYIGLMVACLIAAAMLVDHNSQRGWYVAGVVGLISFATYCVSRTFGLPQATDDIGNWMEPLGLAALFTEGVVTIMSGYVATSLRHGQPVLDVRVDEQIVRERPNGDGARYTGTRA